MTSKDTAVLRYPIQLARLRKRWTGEKKKKMICLGAFLYSFLRALIDMITFNGSIETRPLEILPLLDVARQN